MHNELCERLGIEFPIFAFTHCRDVAAAVSNTGGMGVLGAVGFSAEELEVELTWLDEHVGDRPYGVDIVIPGKYEGMGELDPVKLEAELRAMIPDEHRVFVKKILADHGVPELEGGPKRELLGWTAATAAPLVEVILKHDKVRLVANALGTPPDDVIAKVHGQGMLIAALAGSVKHALNHKAAGVDIVICQGSEGGGHTGDVGSIVLWPEVIDAVAPTPVLAAGGVGSGRQMAAAMVMGAAGVWTGSLWLTVEEAAVSPKQMESYISATSRDTVRSRSWTGKPCRMLKNDWTEAWEQPENPKPLGMPLQMMVAIEAVSPRSCVPRSGRRCEFQPGRPGHWHGDQRGTNTRRGDGHGRGLHRSGGAGTTGRIGRSDGSRSDHGARGKPGRSVPAMELHEALYTTRAMRRVKPDPIPLEVQANSRRGRPGPQRGKSAELAVPAAGRPGQEGGARPAVPTRHGTTLGVGVQDPARRRRRQSRCPRVQAVLPGPALGPMVGRPLRRGAALSLPLLAIRPKWRVHLPGRLERHAGRPSRRYRELPDGTLAVLSSDRDARDPRRARRSGLDPHRLRQLWLPHRDVGCCGPPAGGRGLISERLGPSVGFTVPEPLWSG